MRSSIPKVLLLVGGTVASPLEKLLMANEGTALEQFTAEAADWSIFELVEDHSPNGYDPDEDSWEPWDGTTTYDPREYTKEGFYKEICPEPYKVRGIRQLFYQHEPFADVKNPTKAEVDEWHRLAVNHVRAMVGYTGSEYEINPDKCLHLRALWNDEFRRTTKWDAIAGYSCVGGSGHCGAGFIPPFENQMDYLPDDLKKTGCRVKVGSEGLFEGKDELPWSVKWSGALCKVLKREGFWGGHVGPWFHRTLFGWNFWPGAGLRAKWGGPEGRVKFENPDITQGNFLVNGAEARFPGFECEGRMWREDLDPTTATTCYDSIMANPACGKRFVTYNTHGNNHGCACYEPGMTTCKAKKVSGRKTWDVLPVPTSADGYFFPSEEADFPGEACQDIQWKGTAGSAFHCLQKIVEMMKGMKDPECGFEYITWNSFGDGGCACYPVNQKTCNRIPQSGRMTYVVNLDATLTNGLDIPLCFSGSTLVHRQIGPAMTASGVVESEWVPLDSIHIGDIIEVSKNTFEPVYAFGHHQPGAVASYLELEFSGQHESLQISSDHLIWTATQGAIPASELTVGQQVALTASSSEQGATTGATTVTVIRKVTSKGIYAPFTPSGTLVLNHGIVVSSYVSLEAYTTSLPWSIPMFYHHGVAHVGTFPHRLWCHYLSTCPNPTYTGDGVNVWEVQLLWWIQQAAAAFSPLLFGLIGARACSSSAKSPSESRPPRAAALESPRLFL